MLKDLEQQMRGTQWSMSHYHGLRTKWGLYFGWGTEVQLVKGAWVEGLRWKRKKIKRKQERPFGAWSEFQHFTQPSTLQNQHNKILHTPYTYNNIYIEQLNNPLHKITWSCWHTCRSHASLMQAHAGSCRSNAGFHADTCTLYPYLVDFSEDHSLDTGSELFLPVFPHFSSTFYPFCWQAVHAHDLSDFVSFSFFA